MRILYLETYHEKKPAEGSSSDSIGYGITSSDALLAALRNRGCNVATPDDVASAVGSDSDRATPRARFGLRVLDQVVTQVAAFRPDLIFIFHSFAIPAALVKKALLDMGLRVPLAGYLHGSHWDETDTFRTMYYPGLRWLDLANIAALDVAFVVSHAFLRTLQESLAWIPTSLQREVQDKLQVVPLPIATSLIDTYRERCPARRSGHYRVVFNHAPLPSKRPDIFVNAMHRILDDFPVTCVFTRRLSDRATSAAVDELRLKFEDRVVLSNDLSISDYYRMLWASDFQVSTATHETLGIATLEAMYTENCCLLPDIPAYREITGNYDAVLYQPGAENLYDAIVSYLQAPAEAARAAAHLRDAACMYEPERVASVMLSAFESLVSRAK